MRPPAIHHPPADELLLSLAAGTLPTGIRLVTEIHLELCAACRERVAMLRAVGGALIEEEAAAPMRDDALARAFARIDAMDAIEAVAGADGVAVPRKVPAPPPLPT